METPKGITYQAEYKPDMERMVKALQIIKDAPLQVKEDVPKKDKLQEGA
ncbi:hypothetical protein [Paenibacillus sp. SN-8-1]